VQLVLAHNITQSLSTNILTNSPGSEGVSGSKDIFDFLECTTHGLGEHEEEVDTCCKVEGTEDVVSLPGDVLETGRNGPGKSKVEEPVGSGG